MIWLVLGVVIWSAIHPLQSVAAPARKQLIGKIGPGGYKGTFSLLIIGSIVCMVVGWRSTPHVSIYTPPAWGPGAALALMFVALILFAASGVPTNLKRVVRHPQLTGVCLWSIAHLLANGDLRSLILFGGIGIWALIEMPLVSRREGAWQRPPALPPQAELKPLVAALVVYAVLFFAHPYLFGVSPLAMR